jgi:MerR family copper efflux transcriptional regulator
VQAASAEGRATFSSSELARLTGVSTDTLRHYERKRVLSRPTRLSNGYRRYPAEAAVRVQLIQRALQVGFSLDELARSLGERERGGVPCRGVRALVAERLAELDARTRDLVTLGGEMRQLLDEWDTRLAAAPAGKQARLLDLLVRPGPIAPMKPASQVGNTLLRAWRPPKGSRTGHR